MSLHRIASAILVVLAFTPLAIGQDRLKTMPGYDQYQKMSGQIPGSVKLGALNVTWRDGGKAFDYRKDGKTYRYNVATKKAEEAPASATMPLRNNSVRTASSWDMASIVLRSAVSSPSRE